MVLEFKQYMYCQYDNLTIFKLLVSANQQKTPPQKKSSTTKSTKKPEKSEQTASDESDQGVHEDKNAKKVRHKHLLVGLHDISFQHRYHDVRIRNSHIAGCVMFSRPILIVIFILIVFLLTHTASTPYATAVQRYPFLNKFSSRATASDFQCWKSIYPLSGLQTATKTVAFATKNINLRVKFLLRSPLATICIYMLWHKNLHVRTFFLIVLRSHLLLCSRIKLKIKRRYASKF